MNWPIEIQFSKASRACAPGQKEKQPRRRCLPALAGVALGALLALSACSRNTPTSGLADAAVPVTITNAVVVDIPQQLSAIGTAQPYSTVSVKSQIHGILSKIGFEQGQHVRAGDLIFLIDPRPSESARDQAMANLARDQALLVKADADLGRDAELVTNNIISPATFDQDRANVDSLKAIIAADAAAITNADVQLSFCYIKSPINGRIGRLLVNEGNVVKDLDTVLAVINQITPIYVDFSVPEQYLPTVRERMAGGPLKVEASIPLHSAQCADGQLVLINNQVDSTGTILLRAQFANEDEMLWPGQFVNATLTLNVARNVVVVPSAAVQPSQDGNYVCIIKPDDTVDIRKVELGGRYGALSAVKKGVQAGERVVTSGQLRLVQGGKVKIVSTETGGESKREGG
jgi:membrane fusion protein, multidrug efflux system